MNFADADVVRRILDDAGYREHAGVPSALTADAHHAAKRGVPHDVSRSLVDVYLVNTCAIRDSAETRVATPRRADCVSCVHCVVLCLRA